MVRNLLFTYITMGLPERFMSRLLVLRELRKRSEGPCCWAQLLPFLPLCLHGPALPSCWPFTRLPGLLSLHGPCSGYPLSHAAAAPSACWASVAWWLPMTWLQSPLTHQSESTELRNVCPPAPTPEGSKSASCLAFTSMNLPDPLGA